MRIDVEVRAFLSSSKDFLQVGISEQVLLMVLLFSKVEHNPKNLVSRRP